MVKRLLKLLLLKLLPLLLLLLKLHPLLLLKLHPLRLLLKLLLLLLQSKQLALQATKKPAQAGFFISIVFVHSGNFAPVESILLRRHPDPVSLAPKHIA